METPSTKVTTQVIVGLVATVLAYLAADTSWLEFVPDGAAGPVALTVAAVAAYLTPETNPASSSYHPR
jgi:peptidoglycan/LPS O-acetylase OafA/YrhL